MCWQGTKKKRGRELSVKLTRDEAQQFVALLESQVERLPVDLIKGE